MHPLPKEYEDSIAAEMRMYRDCVDVHRLPSVFHYWSNQHVLPALRAFGPRSPNDLFVRELALQFDRDKATSRTFVSLGSGNCDLEIDLALQLRAQGNLNFHLECVDLNAAMLHRGQAAARRAGVEENLTFHEADLNAWRPAAEYHAVLANQSLHHLMNLESLFAEVRRSLRRGGVFVVSDMIGRNGHLRWPEALDIVHEFWRKLPPSYRMNRASGCYEELFADHDCSREGFEGARSQDILPLLTDRFHFRFFFPFGNAVDPFVDRSFGPNFDPAKGWDRAFIDEVSQRDCLELAAGRLKPTHMVAVMDGAHSGDTVFPGAMSPQYCVRSPTRTHRASILFPAPAYQWPAYQWDEQTHPARQELDRACRMLADSASLIRQRTDWAHELELEVTERIQWGEALERKVTERTEWALKLDAELRERTRWAAILKDEVQARDEAAAALVRRASELEGEVDERTSWALRLERELGDRTNWAIALRAELERQTRRAEAAESEIRGYLGNPLKLLVRIAFGIRNRIRRSR